VLFSPKHFVFVERVDSEGVCGVDLSSLVYRDILIIRLHCDSQEIVDDTR
jgi:hypothetical protein